MYLEVQGGERVGEGDAGELIGILAKNLENAIDNLLNISDSRGELKELGNLGVGDLCITVEVIEMSDQCNRGMERTQDPVDDP